MSQKLSIPDDLFGLILGQSAIEVTHLTRHMMKLRTWTKGLACGIVIQLFGKKLMGLSKD